MTTRSRRSAAAAPTGRLGARMNSRSANRPRVGVRVSTHPMNPPDRSSAKRRRQPVRPCIGTLTLRSKLWIERDGQFAIGQGGAAATGDRGPRVARRSGSPSRLVLPSCVGYVRRAESALAVSLISTRPRKGSRRGATISDAARNIIATLLERPKSRRRSQGS